MKKRFLKKIIAAALMLAIICSMSIAACADGPEYSISMACSSTEKTNIGSNTVLNFNYRYESTGLLPFMGYFFSPLHNRIPE